MNGDYTIMVATHRPEFGDDAMCSLLDYNPVRVDGNGFPSCSYLWNQCVDRCPTETVIICNERARPTKANIKKMLDLLDEGYALVGLYRFGFFGFPKETLREIGMFDEGFRGGWFEDNDTILRLRESDLGYYESEEVPYLLSESTWTHDGNRDRYLAKWNQVDWSRKLDEPDLPYQLGRRTRQAFLQWKDSILLPHSGGQYT